MNAFISLDNSNAAQQREDVNVLNYNYNHYNLLFSHIMIIVIILDEDTLYGQDYLKISFAF